MITSRMKTFAVKTDGAIIAVNAKSRTELNEILKAESIKPYVIKACKYNISHNKEGVLGAIGGMWKMYCYHFSSAAIKNLKKIKGISEGRGFLSYNRSLMRISIDYCMDGKICLQNRENIIYFNSFAEMERGVLEFVVKCLKDRGYLL